MGKTNKLEANEVLRVFGPFPSICNRLSGTYDFDASKGRLRVVYSEMFDGLGKQLAAKDGSTQRVVDLTVKYAGPRVLVAASGPSVLVFEKIPSIREELVRLRVLNPEPEPDAESKTK
mmetsp:Transcript_5515/g.13719  ORF Transcript_5515/g.13719 Transcript_5515/m.13719 type:complete len:118 (-) Transcript_5515:49-402(-)